MSRKVIVVMEVHDKEMDNTGVHAGIEGAFGNDVSVEQVTDYPFDGNFRPDYLDVYNEVTHRLASECENILADETIMNIVSEVIEDISDDVSETLNNAISERIAPYVKEE